MKNYFKIYLLFLVPACLALSIGFYRTYVEQTKRINDTFNSNYERVTRIYADQLGDLDRYYESIMKNALNGIRDKFYGRVPSTKELQSLAKEYDLTHLFIINKQGRFVRTTNPNDQLSKIPNLFTFSEKYKFLKSNSHHFFTTPIILPFPENTPYKFLTIWDGKKFIEAGVVLNEISANLLRVLDKDQNIVGARIHVGNAQYVIKEPNSSNNDTILHITKDVQVFNQNFVQSSENNSHKYQLTFDVSVKELSTLLSQLQQKYILGFSLTIVLISLLLFLATKFLRSKVMQVTKILLNMSKDFKYDRNIKSIKTHKDFRHLVNAINSLLDGFRTEADKVVQAEKDKAYKDKALQVAHDIKSPLEALKSSKDSLDSLPEEEKRTISLAIERIEQITSELTTNKKPSYELASNGTHLIAAIKTIMSEKSLEFKKYSALKIESKFIGKYFELFSQIDEQVLLRILSNIINNAAEAISFSGVITIELEDIDNCGCIKVIDNGSGFSNEIINKIFEQGFTTKPTGQGLGLYHAKSELEKIGAQIEVLNNPSTVLIKLPLSQLPMCMTKELNLKGINKVYILDDENHVHEKWNTILNSSNAELVHLNEGKKLLNEVTTIKDDEILLSDFVLAFEGISGIDVIKKLKAEKRSILTTGSKLDEVMKINLQYNKISYLSKHLMECVPKKFC